MAVVLRRCESAGRDVRQVRRCRIPEWVRDLWLTWVAPARWNIVGALVLAAIGLLGYQLLSGVGEYVTHRLGSLCTCL